MATTAGTSASSSFASCTEAISSMLSSQEAHNNHHRKDNVISKLSQLDTTDAYQFSKSIFKTPSFWVAVHKQLLIRPSDAFDLRMKIKD
jgi:hypothetical protein